MTNGVLGLFVIDVAAYDAVEVAPANNEPKYYSSLVNALGVVAHPRDCIGNARVDA